MAYKLLILVFNRGIQNSFVKDGVAFIDNQSQRSHMMKIHTNKARERSLDYSSSQSVSLVTFFSQKIPF